MPLNLAILAEMLTLIFSAAFFFGIWWSLGLLSKFSEMDIELNILTRTEKEIRLDMFAINCGIHVLLAKWYLNSKARQLNGIKEGDDLGDAVYLFGEAKRKFLQEHLAQARKN